MRSSRDAEHQTNLAPFGVEPRGCLVTERRTDPTLPGQDGVEIGEVDPGVGLGV